MDLFDIRREYNRDGLRRKDLTQNPFEQFDLWLKQAIEINLPDPTAMTIATVDEKGQPFQRIVLLKQVDEQGFVFYTNLSSRKANHLKMNKQISLHFPWHIMERQIHVTGYVEELGKREVMRYFLSRPKESQLAAWVSRQSERLSTRNILEMKYQELKEKFAQGKINVPSFWGGYRVKVNSMEFWQGGKHRLHDRFIYQNDGHNNWTIERLAP